MTTAQDSNGKYWVDLSDDPHFDPDLITNFCNGRWRYNGCENDLIEGPYDTPEEAESRLRESLAGTEQPGNGSLLEQIKSGRRKVVVALYRNSREIEYQELTLAEARNRVRTPLSKGLWFGLPTWQWFNDKGDYEADPLGFEVSAVKRAVFGE